jgi:hypothetical protein
MPAKSKQDRSTLLGGEPTKPAIRRGQGLRLSTEPPAAESQERESAVSQSSENAVSQKRNTAETQSSPKRVNRGYMLREDLIKAFKRLAVDEDRKLYEVMEEALEQYLAQHGQS